MKGKDRESDTRPFPFIGFSTSVALVTRAHRGGPSDGPAPVVPWARRTARRLTGPTGAIPFLACGDLDPRQDISRRRGDSNPRHPGVGAWLTVQRFHRRPNPDVERGDGLRPNLSPAQAIRITVPTTSKRYQP